MRRVVLIAIMLAMLSACSAETSEPSFTLQEVKESLDLNFTGTTWYSTVQRLDSPGGGRINVYTSLYPDDEGKEFAKDTCNKIFVNVAHAGVDEVAVFGQDGRHLVTCP